MSVYKRHHLHWSIKFATHKVQPGALTAATVKNSFKGIIESFVANNKAFSFMSSFKETPAYSKEF